MKKKDRIRLYGARLNRFIYRFFIFIGMLAFYSLVYGAGPGEDAGTASFGQWFVIVLAIGLVVIWFRNRDQRELDRSHQLAAEVALLFPYATEAEQNHEYTLRRQREMRLEALFYFILAVITFVWFYGMYAANAEAASWVIGVIIIAPGLLLISAVLLVRSLLPCQHDKEMPDVSDANRIQTQIILEKEDVQLDRAGYHTVFNLSVDKQSQSADDYLKREQAVVRSNYIVSLVGKAFFFILPLILFGFGIIMFLADGPKWFLLFSGILAFASTTLWLYMTHLPGSVGTTKAARRRLKQLRSGKCRAYCDSILSHRMGTDAAEIVFSQSGKVRYPCNSRTYNQLFPVPRQKAIVVTCEDKIQSIALLPSYEDTAPAAALSGDDAATGAEANIPLSDGELHQAALQEIERMSPSRRREMEAEIEQLYEQSDILRQRSYTDLSALEREEIDSASWADVQKSCPDLTLSGIEAALMEKLNVSRDDIMNMKKNPFAPDLRRKLLTAALVEIVGVAAIAIAEKATGARLGYLYLIISAVAGCLAMSCGDAVMNMNRFRKLQKAYRDPAYRRKMLDAAVYREIKEQVKQRRGAP